jgi:hypothetical protein
MNKRCKKSTCATQVCILWLELPLRRRFAVVHLLLVGLPGSKSCQRRILRLLSVRSGRTENIPLRLGGHWSRDTLALMIGQNYVQIKRAPVYKAGAVCERINHEEHQFTIKLNLRLVISGLHSHYPPVQSTVLCYACHHSINE